MQLTWTDGWSFGSATLEGARGAGHVRTRTLAGVVLIAAVLPYLNALSADFTFDDVGMIRDNPAVQVLPTTALLTFVYQPGGLYRPLTMLTYAANAGLSADPFGFHLVNCSLHALMSLAVFFLALRVFASIRVGGVGQTGAGAATIAAVLFAVHPIHTEAVTNIVGRAELLAALGVVASLLAFARSLDSRGHGRIAWQLLSVVAFFAAMLAKESAFAALGLLVVLHWWLRRDATRWQRMAAIVPYAATSAAYLALRYAVVGALGLPKLPSALDNPLAYVDAATRLRTATVVLWQYTSQLLVPLHLSADYSFAQIPLALSWTDPRFLVGATVVAVLALAGVAAAQRMPVLALAGLFMLMPLAITANVLFPIGTIKAERLLYLPSIGWCLGLGWLAAAVVNRRPVWALPIAIVVILYGGRTWARNYDWRDERALFSATAIDAPASAKAHYNFAVALDQTGAWQHAEEEYREALRIYPDYSAAPFGIGVLHLKHGDEAGAMWWYEEAVRRSQPPSNAHLHIAVLRAARGEYDTAEAACRTGLASDPNSLMLLAELSAIRVAQGDRWEARATLDRLDRLGTIDRQERDRVAEMRGDVEAALQ